MWLVKVSAPLRITVNCSQLNTKKWWQYKTFTVLKLYDEFSIVTTKVQTQFKRLCNFTDNSHRENIAAKMTFPEVLNNTNIANLDVAHKNQVNIKETWLLNPSKSQTKL